MNEINVFIVSKELKILSVVVDTDKILQKNGTINKALKLTYLKIRIRIKIRDLFDPNDVCRFKNGF